MSKDTDQILQQNIQDNTPLLYWTKNAFSLNYSIFENGQVVGKIADKSINRSVKASLFQKKYLFESEGFLKPHINIFDVGNKEEIGQIDFEIIRARATVNLSGQHFYWKFSNLLHTKWKLEDLKENTILSGEKRKEGVFRNHPEAMPILLLCALVIRNRFIKQGY